MYKRQSEGYALAQVDGVYDGVGALALKVGIAVDEGDDRIGLEIVEGLRSEFAATAQQVGHGDDGDRRGILEHGDAFVADGRQDGAHGLREDNERHGLEVVEAERRFAGSASTSKGIL